MNVDGLILLNQSRATVPFDQDDGRGRGARTEEDGFSLKDGQESGRIQHRRRQGHVTSIWCKLSSR